MSRIFSSVNVETMACRLCEVIHLSNKEGYLCGHGIDQVYGCAYAALKNLLYKEIGAKATEIAMNCNGWDCSEFIGQIIPSLEHGIEEAAIEDLIIRARKMMDFLESNVGAGWNFDYYRGDAGITVFLHDEPSGVSIPLNWNNVHDFVDEHQ